MLSRECSLPIFVVKSNVFPIEALAGNGGENCSHRLPRFSHHPFSIFLNLYFPRFSYNPLSNVLFIFSKVFSSSPFNFFIFRGFIISPIFIIFSPWLLKQNSPLPNVSLQQHHATCSTFPIVDFFLPKQIDALANV